MNWPQPRQRKIGLIPIILHLSWMAAVKNAAKKGNLAKLPAMIIFEVVTTEINRKMPGAYPFDAITRVNPQQRRAWSASPMALASLPVGDLPQWFESVGRFLQQWGFQEVQMSDLESSFVGLMKSTRFLVIDWCECCIDCLVNVSNNDHQVGRAFDSRTMHSR